MSRHMPKQGPVDYSTGYCAVCQGRWPCPGWFDEQMARWTKAQAVGEWPDVDCNRSGWHTHPRALPTASWDRPHPALTGREQGASPVPPEPPR